jgi:hypothetical protein
MKIHSKKESKQESEAPLIDKEGLVVESPPKKKKSEAEGSRWAALILLVITLLFGVWFYIQGIGGWESLGKKVGGIFSGWGGQSTYVLEKN